MRYKNTLQAKSDIKTHTCEKKKMRRANHTNNLKRFCLRTKNRRKLCLLPPRLDKTPSVSGDLTGFKTTLQSEVLGKECYMICLLLLLCRSQRIDFHVATFSTLAAALGRPIDCLHTAQNTKRRSNLNWLNIVT